MPSSKKKGSRKKKKSPAAKEKQINVDDHGDSTEMLPKRHNDEELFSSGYESHLAECPICNLPMPLSGSQHCLMLCCSKRICRGCVLAIQLADKKAGRECVCAFCRARIPEKGPSESKKVVAMVQKRVEAGDVNAIRKLGDFCVFGEEGVPINFAKGFELWKEAATLGDVDAHGKLASAYEKGGFGLKKDINMAVYHYEVAAMGGHFGARHNLGVFEANHERFDRALRHWVISAKIGYEESLKHILKLHQRGHARKEDYARALQGFRKATDEMRSSRRDKARNHYK